MSTITRPPVRTIRTGGTPAATVQHAARPRPAHPEPPPPRGPLGFWFVTLRQTRPIRVALAEGGYIGATLIIGGLMLLLALNWQELSAAGVLAGLAVILAALGVAVGGGPANLNRLREPASATRRHVTGALFAVAAATGAEAVGSAVDHRSWFTGTMCGLILALLAYVAVPTATGLITAIGLASLCAVSTVVSFGRATPLAVGAALLLTAAILGLASGIGLLPHQRLGLSLAGVLALVGAQQPLAWSATLRWAYGLSLAVGLVGLLLFALLRVTALLVVGVMATAAAVLEATWDLTNGATRIAVTLIATGVALIITSAYGISFWQNGGRARVSDVSARAGTRIVGPDRHSPARRRRRRHRDAGTATGLRGCGMPVRAGLPVRPAHAGRGHTGLVDAEYANQDSGSQLTP